MPAAVLLLHMLVIGVAANPAGETDDRHARKRQLRQERMRNDMRYGTDNYFGANRDVWYADMVRPTPVKIALPEPETTTASERSAPRGDNSSSSPPASDVPTTDAPTTDPPPPTTPPSVDPPPPPPPPPT